MLDIELELTASGAAHPKALAAFRGWHSKYRPAFIDAINQTGLAKAMKPHGVDLYPTAWAVSKTFGSAAALTAAMLAYSTLQHAREASMLAITGICLFAWHSAYMLQAHESDP